MSARLPAGSCRQRSSAHPHLPFFDDPTIRGDELKVDDQGSVSGCETSFEPFHPPNESPRHPSVHGVILDTHSTPKPRDPESNDANSAARDSASLKRKVRRFRRTSAIERHLPRSSVGHLGGSSLGGTSASHRRRILARNTSAGASSASFRCIDALSSSLRSRPISVFNPAAPPRALVAASAGSARLGLCRQILEASADLRRYPAEGELTCVAVVNEQDEKGAKPVDFDALRLPTGQEQGKVNTRHSYTVKLNRLSRLSKGLQNLYSSVRSRPAPPT